MASANPLQVVNGGNENIFNTPVLQIGDLQPGWASLRFSPTYIPVQLFCIPS